MSKFVTWVAGFLSESAPGSSSTRLIMLAGTMIPLLLWTGLSVYHRQLQSIPESVLVFVSLCLGLKGLHKAFETRKDVAQIEKDKPIPPVEAAQKIGTVVQVEAQG